MILESENDDFTSFVQAGGSFPEMPYIYTDDHFSDNDNDAVDDFTNDNNDLSRDSSSGGRGGGGGGGGGEGEHGASGGSTTTPFDGNTDGHGNAPPTTKRLKLEPVEFTEASACSGGEGLGVQGFTQPGRKGEDSNLQEKTQTEEQVAEFTGLAGVVVVPAVGRDSGLGHRAGTAGRDSALGQDCSHRVRKSPPFGIQPSLHQSSHVGVPGCSAPRVGPSRGPWPQPHSPFSQSAQGGNAGVGGPGMTAYNNAPTSVPSGTLGGAVGCSPGGGAQGGRATVPAGMVLVEEDDDWLFGRYLVSELKKVKSFKDKQLAKMKMQQIVTYAQLGMDQQPSPAAPDA